MGSETEQYKAYRLLAEAAGEYGAIVRLFDVGGEFGPDLKERERSPALGVGAVRFNLHHTEIMRTQVRAILRAAAAGRLSLVIPMVGDVADVRSARNVIDEETARLRDEGATFAEVQVGAMIEIPSAVLTAEKI